MDLLLKMTVGTVKVPLTGSMLPVKRMRESITAGRVLRVSLKHRAERAPAAL